MLSASRGRPVAAVVASVVALVVLTACDDGSDSSSAKRRRSTTPTTTPTTTTTTSAGGSTTTSSSIPPLTPAPANSCGNQTEVIVEAVEGTEVVELAGKQDQYSVQNCRMSQSELIWALVDLVPDPGSTFAPTAALMERIGATWTVKQVGTSRETCEPPERARIELELVCAE